MSIFKSWFREDNDPVFAMQEINDILLVAAVQLKPENIPNPRVRAAVQKIQAITTMDDLDGVVKFRIPSITIVS